MYHYVYRLDHIETGEFYIGSRTSKVLPHLDTYMGSMSVWKPDKNKLIKTILKFGFENRDDTMQFESETIKKYINDDLNRNYYIPNKGYHTTGQTTVIDKNGNTFNVPINDHRYLTGELVGVNKGRITVKDYDGNFFNVSINDPRYLSGELVGGTKGKVIVKDENGKKYSVFKNDPRYLSGEFIDCWKGKKHNDDTLIKMSNAKKGKYKGEKNSQFGTCWITNGFENKKIKNDELDKWISNGWEKGRKIKK